VIELLSSDIGITEDGEIYKPIFHVIGRFVIGYERTLRRFASDVERRVEVGT
jgi:hypothetical protein